MSLCLGMGKGLGIVALEAHFSLHMCTSLWSRIRAVRFVFNDLDEPL